MIKNEEKEKVKNYERLKETAKDIFLSRNVTARDLSDMLGVSEQTISKWRKGKDGERSWDDIKNEFSLTPSRIKEILLKEAHKISQGEKSAIDADALSKITAAIDRLDKRINVRMVIDVLKELDNYTAEIDPKFAAEATKYHRLFIQHRIKLEV